jgi:hypothetical protein
LVVALQAGWPAPQLDLLAVESVLAEEQHEVEALPLPLPSPACAAEPHANAATVRMRMNLFILMPKTPQLANGCNEKFSSCERFLERLEKVPRKTHRHLAARAIF